MLQIDTTEIIDDEFVIRVLENDLLIAKLIKIYQPKKIRDKFISNKYYPSKKDTLSIFIVERDTIGFHKGQGNAFLQKLVLTSTKLTLDKDIKIGVDKDLLRKKFKKQTISNIVKIQNIEGGDTFMFFFKENKLNKIIYEATYID